MEAADFERALRPLLRRGAAYAAAMLRDRAEAEDAVQQAALQAWHRRAQFDGRHPFRPWWFAILRHHCLDRMRARARAPAAGAPEDPALASSPDESVLDRRALAAAMDKLSEGQREILRLRYFADLTYRELAQVLEIPPGTVMSRLHLARKALAALLTTEVA